MNRPAAPWPSVALGLPLLLCLVLPIVALAGASSPGALWAALHHPLTAQAAWLSLRTTTVSLALIVAGGLPLAWWLARAPGRLGQIVESVVALPVVIPPAVIGVALLHTYGRGGVLGPLLIRLDWALPFTPAAVVMAQVVVAGPFFIQGATAGLRQVDPDLLLVARTLGASPLRTFFRVAVPAAWPALVGGAALCWARALGEFGATLLFAGNLTGRTQTLPLAIFAALEADLNLARAIALLLGGAALLTLLLVRLAPRRRAPVRP